MEGILLGFGNPLLDISANVPHDVLTKYDLQPGNAILADPSKHLPLYDELVKNYPVEYIAGGAAQNSIRAAQWMLQVPKATGYFGAIGKDHFGDKLKHAAESGGVTTHYVVLDTVQTGTCAVLVEAKERSLVANLAAANCFTKEHFQNADIQQAVQKAKFFYCEGYFLTVSTDTMVEVGKHAKETNKYFLTNLSAPFLIDFFWDNMTRVLPYADVVFGNETEAATLGKKANWGTDLNEIALKLADYPKENQSRKRMVIFTQGARNTIVCYDGKIQHFSPLKCDPSEIVDTNGAGDSFVGGFLSRFVQNKPIDECIAAAHYCAFECIRRSGCTFPEKCNFSFP